MKKIRLGVNIDHVATVRNARGEKYPSPLQAAICAQKAGADSITVHLREDRRHIDDNDIKEISLNFPGKLNLEMAATEEMLAIAEKIKPFSCCIVPEKREEVTTEGGLNLKKNKSQIKKIISKFKKKKIRTSLFINPSLLDVKISKDLGADCIEIHTGRLANLVKSKMHYFCAIMFFLVLCRIVFMNFFDLSCNITQLY